MPEARYLNTGDDGPDDALEDLARTEAWLDAGAPSMAELWERAQGTFTDPPMTVKQAAKRAGVHEKTIRRRLRAWAALEPPAAEQIGRAWRISPDALQLMNPTQATTTPARSKRRRRAQEAPESERW